MVYLLFLCIHFPSDHKNNSFQIAMNSKAILLLDFLVPSIESILILNLLILFHSLLLRYQSLFASLQQNFLNSLLMRLFLLLLGLLPFAQHLLLLKMHLLPTLKKELLSLMNILLTYIFWLLNAGPFLPYTDCFPFHFSPFLHLIFIILNIRFLNYTFEI